MGKELQLFLKGLEGKTTIIRIDEVSLILHFLIRVYLMSYLSDFV